MVITDDGIVEALQRIIAGDAAIAARLETYMFTTGLEDPAVFTTQVFPKNARFPAIILDRVGGSDFGSRGKKGEDVGVDVRLYGDRDRDARVLRKTAELLHGTLNRSTVALVNGFEAFRCMADPPQAVSDEDGFPGYLVRVRVLLIES